MTPFEAAGYTDTTKFRVLKERGELKKDDIVALDYDDSSVCPWFKTEEGKRSYICLPNMAPEGGPEELEVYEEPKKQKQIEYKFYPFVSKLHTQEEIESTANEIGKDGWRLSCMNDTMMIFSREVNDG